MEADINGVVRNILRHVKNSEARFLIKELGRNLKECEEKINDPTRIEGDRERLVNKEILISNYCVIESAPGAYFHSFYSDTVLEPDFMPHDKSGIFLIPVNMPVESHKEE